jgi:hypothetical protein
VDKNSATGLAASPPKDKLKAAATRVLLRGTGDLENFMSNIELHRSHPTTFTWYLPLFANTPWESENTTQQTMFWTAGYSIFIPAFDSRDANVQRHKNGGNSVYKACLRPLEVLEKILTIKFAQSIHSIDPPS